MHLAAQGPYFWLLNLKKEPPPLSLPSPLFLLSGALDASLL